MLEFARENFLRAGGLVLFAFFLPSLVYIATEIKKDRSKKRLDTLEKLYELTNNRYFIINKRNQRFQLTERSYFPALVIFALCLFFSVFLILSNYVVAGDGLRPHFLLSGSSRADQFLQTVNGAQPAQPDSDLQKHQLLTLIAIGYAFLGWYAWSVSTIFGRLVTMEIVPGTLYVVVGRLVLAIVVAAVLFNLSSFVPVLKEWAIPELVGFAAGMFPSTALQYLKNHIRTLLTPNTDAAETPIEAIQGITPYCGLRLYEMGIDNTATLAAANPVEIFDASNLPILEIVDWVAQAQLAVLVGTNNFIRLQRHSIRTIFDFTAAAQAPPSLPQLTGDGVSWSPIQIAKALSGICKDPSYRRLLDFRQRILASDQLTAPCDGLTKQPVCLIRLNDEPMSTRKVATHGTKPSQASAKPPEGDAPQAETLPPTRPPD